MLAVGPGKSRWGGSGAFDPGHAGFVETLPALAQKIIDSAPITAGLALVENAHKQLSHIEAVAPKDFARN